MKLKINQELPESTLAQMTDDGPVEVKLLDLTREKNIILVAMPGAFTRTCTHDHLPSLIRTADSLFKNGIDEIICIVVNDVHVAKAWGEATGATKAGIKIFTDAESKFAKATGLNFSVPIVGFFDRLQRVALVAENNVIKHIQLEQNRSRCDLTSGETLLSITKKLLAN
jgi:cytochrome c peroxidase